MSDQNLSVVEEHPTWCLLSSGDVILPGHPMWGKYPGQSQQALSQPAGPRTLDMREFNEMSHEDRWKAHREGVQIVDPDEAERKAQAARVAAEALAFRERGPTISKETFEAMSHEDRWKAHREGARIID